MDAIETSPDGPGPGTHWQVADIDFTAVDRDAIAGDALAFRIVFLASLVETGSDLYAGNLVACFGGDDEVARWLVESWQVEEMRHGHALRSYVEHVWPEIDWQRSYDAFFAEYSRTCTVDQLAPERALELAARCMVETGTATLYGALHRYAREPVLKDLAARIYADEVRHYKMFSRHFGRYQRREGRSRLRVGRTLLNRLLATRSEDGRCAYRHVWDFAPNPAGEPLKASYAAFVRDLTAVLRRHAPAEMLTRMILKPLALPSPVVDAATRLSGPLYGLWLSAAR